MLSNQGSSVADSVLWTQNQLFSRQSFRLDLILSMNQYLNGNITCQQVKKPGGCLYVSRTCVDALRTAWVDVAWNYAEIEIWKSPALDASNLRIFWNVKLLLTFRHSIADNERVFSRVIKNKAHYMTSITQLGSENAIKFLVPDEPTSSPAMLRLPSKWTSMQFRLEQLLEGMYEVWIILNGGVIVVKYESWY